ncbi:MAG: cytochrome c biogenesis CcdA family protein [Anaerolineae bacterium]
MPTDSILVMGILAFTAGVLSFLSPCTLPVLPAYFAFTFQSSRRQVVAMSLSFFVGLAVIFSFLGASATLLGNVLRQQLPTLITVGGWVIVIFGVLTILGKGFQGLNLQTKPAASLGGSLVFGATFALGWTSCIGPILGSLLILAGTTASVYQGMIFLFVYALGLALPLILISVLIGRSDRNGRVWRLLRGKAWSLEMLGRTLRVHSTSAASGVLLVALGAAMITGTLTRFNSLIPVDLQIWFIGVEEWILRTLA